MSMTLEEYKKAEQYTKQVLDSINITQIVVDHSEIKTSRELATFLEKEYIDLANNEYMHGYLLNWLNDAEFIDYLRERYGDSFRCMKVAVNYIEFV